MKIYTAALFCLLLFSFSALAQTPTPTPPDDEDVVKITTALIQVDVTVTDKKGKIVTNLKPEDFEIYENGERQTITNFSFISAAPSATPAPSPSKNAAPVAAPPVSIKPEQVKRTIALVVDDLTLSFESTYYVQQSLKKFVNEQMQDGDLVAIIRTGAGIGALQQFTSDKRQLFAAIEKIRWNPNGTGRIGAFAPIQGGGLQNERQTGDEDETRRDTAREFDEFRESVFATGTLGALNYIVRGMRELPGRKSVMLFSDGFRIFSRASGFAEANHRVLDSLRRLTDLANRASVVIYTMDARGLQSLGLTAEDDTSGLSADQVEQRLSDRRSDFFDTQEGLIYLARQTGGFSIRNNNDLSQGVERMLEDQKGFYLIGYQPDAETFDPQKRRYNKLVIKVKNPDLRVRYRSGFFGISDEEARPTRQTAGQALISALTSPFAASGINVRMNTLFANDAKNGSYVRSLLHISGKDLKFEKQTDGSYKTVFDILAVSFGDNGIPADEISKTYTLTLKEEAYRRVLEKGFVYSFYFPVKKAGAYQLRAAIRDSGSEKTGSANQFVEVPNLKKERLTLSGIVLENLTAQQWQKLSNSNAENVRGELESDPMTDTSLRRFQSGTILRYGFEIYNAKLNPAQKPQIKMQIKIFRDGQPYFESAPSPIDFPPQSDLQRLKVTRAINLGTEMKAGEYVLQVIVTDELAKEKRKIASQFVQFDVVR
jgi:VWFA-related protein